MASVYLPGHSKLSYTNCLLCVLCVFLWLRALLRQYHWFYRSVPIFSLQSRTLRELRSSNSCCPCMIFICDCRFSTKFVRLCICSACCSSRSGRECVLSRSLPTSESSECWVFSNLSMRARFSLTRSDRGNRELTLLSSICVCVQQVLLIPLRRSLRRHPILNRGRPRGFQYGGLHRSAIGSNYPKVVRRLGFALTQRDGLARLLRVSVGLPRQFGGSPQSSTLERLLPCPRLTFRTP